MKMLKIRLVKPSDQDAILELGKNFINSPYEVDRVFKKYSNNSIPLIIQRQIESTSIITFIAEFNNKVIGFISFLEEQSLSQYLQQFNQNSPNCASILFLTVNLEFRNKGIANILLNFCLEYCIKNKIQIIRLGTDYGNHQALSLYQKNGFKVVLNWHIYRIYRDQLKSLTYNPSLLENSMECDLIDKIIQHRPIPWYYEPLLSKDHVKKYMINNIQKQINSKNIIYIQKKKNNKSFGLTIKKDSLREQHYKLPGTIWTLYDLFETGIKGEFLPEFINNYLYQLPNFLMAEIWVGGNDYQLQKILTESGMYFVYGGISLRKEL